MVPGIKEFEEAGKNALQQEWASEKPLLFNELMNRLNGHLRSYLLNVALTTRRYKDFSKKFEVISNPIRRILPAEDNFPEGLLIAWEVTTPPSHGPKDIYCLQGIYQFALGGLTEPQKEILTSGNKHKEDPDAIYLYPAIYSSEKNSPPQEIQDMKELLELSRQCRLYNGQKEK